jgi:hypothetical protein
MKSRTITLLLLLASSAAAQHSTKPLGEPPQGGQPAGAVLNQQPRQLSDANKYKLILKYQKAMTLQAQLQQAAKEYQDLQKQALTEGGYPEACGAQARTNDCSNVAIDAQAETVSVTVAPAQAPPTPAAPAPAPTGNKPPVEQVPPVKK